MKYSKIALKIWAAKEKGLIKTNAQFWSNFSNLDKIESLLSDDESEKIVGSLTNQYKDDEGVICAFDDEFPLINLNVKNSEKPFLLFYKGNIELLQNLNNNVAVIGLINPTQKIEDREKIIVEELVKRDLVIVSGLAKGCDTIAHRTCVDNNGKTIAILPSQINKITPAANKNLASEIISKGGLLLSEYYKDTTTRQEAIGRFVERDRLQAMFSKSIVLIASYRKGEGDSGSRHAMTAATKYKIDRYVMYNDLSDKDDVQFGLNKEYVEEEYNGIEALTKNSIEFIKNTNNSYLAKKNDMCYSEQLRFF